MLHGPVLLFRLIVLVLCGIQEKKVLLSVLYLLNGYFAFGIFTTHFLFLILTPFDVNEFGEVLAFAFKVIFDLTPYQVFLMFVEY